MKYSFISRVLHGFVLPFTFIVLVISLLFSFNHWNHSLITGFNFTLRYFAVIFGGVFINFVTAFFEIERPKAVKIFFTIVSGTLFLPVLIVAVLVGIPISLIKPLRESRVGCYITTFFAHAGAMAIGAFHFSFGAVSACKKLPQKILALTHHSAFDYILACLVAGYTMFRVLIGANLFKKILFRAFFKMVGIPVYRGKGELKLRAGSVEKSHEFFDKHKKATEVIYLQGTRSRDGNILPFQNGAFTISIEKNVPICPIIVFGSDKIRKPGPQDIGSYKEEEGKDRKTTQERINEIVPSIKSLVKLIFTEGINPGIVITYYLPPEYPDGINASKFRIPVEVRVKNEYERIGKMKFKLLQLLIEDLQKKLTNFSKFLDKVSEKFRKEG